MTQQEFEALIGQPIGGAAYQLIEEMYMAAENTDKETFAAAWQLIDKTVKKGKTQLRNYVDELVRTINVRNVQLNSRNQKIAQLESDIEYLTNKKEEYKTTGHELYAKNNELDAQKVQLAKALVSNGLADEAAKILGAEYVIGLKCAHGIELNDFEKNYLAETFYINA